MAYLPLSTANLPDPAIDPAQGASPEDHFGVDAYTGTGASHERSALQFQPDLVWIKGRSDAYSSRIFDSVRGADKVLVSDTTAAEFDGGGTTYFTSFDSDGFTLTSNISVNGSSKTFVAWNWKANGSGVTNTDGSITSTVSANTTSGFSIVSYVGNSTTGATVGHGLNQAPEFIMVKDRNDGAQPFSCFHVSVGNQYWLRLDSTSAPIDADSAWNDTSPSATVFTLGAGNIVNQSGNNVIAYCFHSVEGFSKFGSYVGNGSTDGPFVYTGFRPAFVLFKKINVTTASWAIRDNTRYTYNPTRNTLYADKSDAEYTGTAHDIDFLSNGFKPRTTDGLFNSSGATYIYMAFAENPFKFSTAS